MIFVLGGERHKYAGFVCDTFVLLYFITWGFVISDPKKGSWSDRESSKTWHHLLKHDQVHLDKNLQSLAVFTVANSHFRVAPQAQLFSLHFYVFSDIFWAWETSADPTNEEWFTCRNLFSQFFYSWAAGLIYKSQLIKQRPKDKLTTRFHSQHFIVQSRISSKVFEKITCNKGVLLGYCKVS